MEIQRQIVWDETALNEFVSALQWIGKKSIQGAEIVEQGILNSIVASPRNPERFPPISTKEIMLEISGHSRHTVRGSLFALRKMKFKFSGLKHVRQKTILY